MKNSTGQEQREIERLRALECLTIVEDNIQGMIETLMEVGYCEDHLICLQISLQKIETIRAALQSLDDVPDLEKIAPVQGFSAGIPWDMHLRAYDAYCKKYGKQHALIDLEGRNCRGGFGTGELDDFIPQWREELEERRKALQQPEQEWQPIETAPRDGNTVDLLLNHNVNSRIPDCYFCPFHKEWLKCGTDVPVVFKGDPINEITHWILQSKTLPQPPREQG